MEHIPSVTAYRRFRLAYAEDWQPWLRVSEGGGLTLNLRDAPRLGELAREGLLDRWAREADFYLEGDLSDFEIMLDPIDHEVALQHIWHKLVLPACAELLEDEQQLTAVEALMRGEMPTELPDVYIGLDACGVGVSLVHLADGPFISPDEFENFLERRMGYYEVPRKDDWERP